MFFRKSVRASVLLGAACVALGSLGGTAWAGGNGAQTFTQHAHGSDAAGLVVVDFNPNSQNNPGISAPAGCWLPDTYALVSTNGNAVAHGIGNNTGFWFTTTFTGQAEALPLVLDTNGNPIPDPNNTGNDLVDTTAAPIATGHMTTWFGSEDNNKNGVFHATLTFHGTDIAGNPADISGHFQFAMNANGQPTAMVGTVSC
ncbi:MAG TPA: hypothetical protein VFV02_10630 [Acidimicrobiales bacterium]|nr:hypothetical protein [Acidimicrobiales bacterium]